MRASPSSVTSVARSCPAVRIAIVTPIGSSMSSTYSGSVKPRMTFVRSNTNSSWLRGMPIMSRMIRSGSRAATSVTKSPSPRSAISSTISAATPSTSAFISPSCRGVNPRDTMRRMRACRGSSRLIIDPKNSMKSGGRSAMFVPLPEQNSSGCRLACDDVGVPGQRPVGRLLDAHVGQAGERHLGDGPFSPQQGERLGPLVERPGPPIEVGQVDLVHRRRRHGANVVGRRRSMTPVSAKSAGVGASRHSPNVAAARRPTDDRRRQRARARASRSRTSCTTVATWVPSSVNT